MRAADLTVSDAPPNEVPDYGINISGNPQEHLNVVGAEEIHGFWSHAPDNNMRDVVLGRRCW